MCVAHASRAGSGVIAVGSGHIPPMVAAGMIVITPVERTLPVSGLPVKSVFTDSVSRPSGVTVQLQHSDSSSLASKTKMSAQRLPPEVPGLVMRTISSGAPAVLALEK